MQGAIYHLSLFQNSPVERKYFVNSQLPAAVNNNSDISLAVYQSHTPVYKTSKPMIAHLKNFKA